MTMKNVLLASLFSLVSIASTQARIFETKEQCLKRYGKPVINEEKRLGFMKPPIMVMLEFHKGKAAAVHYMRIERDNMDVAKELSAKQIEIILKANTGKSSWRKSTTDNPRWQSWLRNDNKVQAIYHRFDSNSLSIKSIGYLELQKSNKIEKEVKELEGL